MKTNTLENKLFMFSNSIWQDTRKFTIMKSPSNVISVAISLHRRSGTIDSTVKRSYALLISVTCNRPCQAPKNRDQWEAIALWCMWQAVYTEGSPFQSSENPQWREVLSMWYLWQAVYSENKPYQKHKNPK